MTDVFTTDKRSWIMSRVSGRNTKPEIIVRKIIHRMGYRFRLHERKLPGKPDIVLPKHKKIILIHGCFWHGHHGCKRSKRPESNADFWNKKIDGNITRDEINRTELEKLGWKVLIVWDCQTRDLETLKNILAGFLGCKGDT